mmetsp:Transcript_90720/g.280578  ORF Transcript_90720/g.280578 Transcript_90720/m.280578 type:complete len:231 (-) Transcript_90720:2372-3064(-)
MSSRFLAFAGVLSWALASSSMLRTPFTCESSWGAMGSPICAAPPADLSCTAWFWRATLDVVESFCCVFVGSGHGTGVSGTTGAAECCGAVESRGGPPAIAALGLAMLAWPGGSTPGPGVGAAMWPPGGPCTPTPGRCGAGPMPGPGMLGVGPMPGPGIPGAGPMPGPGMPGIGAGGRDGAGPMPGPGMLPPGSLGAGPMPGPGGAGAGPGAPGTMLAPGLGIGAPGPMPG